MQSVAALRSWCQRPACTKNVETTDVLMLPRFLTLCLTSSRLTTEYVQDPGPA